MKGNITSKSDAGTYTYGNSGKPYAVTEVNQSGSAVPARAQDVTYTSFWRPATISENGYVASFTYNCEGDRVRMRMRHNGSASYTRYYLGNCYEIDSTSTARERLYLGGDYYTAPAVLVKTSSGANIGQIAKSTFTGAFWGAVGGLANFASADTDLIAQLFKHSFTEGIQEGLQGGQVWDPTRSPIKIPAS